MNNKLNYPTWLVSLDIAKKLKKIGFNEPCMLYYESSISEVLLETTVAAAERGLFQWFEPLDEFNFFYNEEIGDCITIPTWEQALAWFRGRGLHCSIRYLICPVTYSFHIIDNCNWDKGCGNRDTYEEAREACVEELIKIFKENKDKLK